MLDTNKNTMNRRIIKTNNAPAPVGAYNQAVLVNGFLYVSGQIAINPADGTMVLEEIKKETKQVMENIGAVLKEVGYDYSNIVKSSIFLNDMNNFSKVNEVYSSYFNDALAPARECVEVSCLPKNVNVEISVIAYN
jgi:2-iminobutanoate/2-iminopropanoate deaminase